jgi:hypothetical protein
VTATFKLAVQVAASDGERDAIEPEERRSWAGRLTVLAIALTRAPFIRSLLAARNSRDAIFPVAAASRL